MKWFNRKKKEQVEERSSNFDYLMYNGGASYSTSKAMLLSTVYRCVEVISDSVAQLPLEPYRMDANGYKVNPSTSRTHTRHGKKATSKTPTSSSGNIYRRERISVNHRDLSL